MTVPHLSAPGSRCPDSSCRGPPGTADSSASYLYTSCWHSIFSFEYVQCCFAFAAQSSVRSAVAAIENSLGHPSDTTSWVGTSSGSDRRRSRRRVDCYLLILIGSMGGFHRLLRSL